MVKLIIMDVDGVIVGHKVGVNFPYPSQKVLTTLKKIRESGIPIVLCSGKSGWVIEPIILKASLNNPHIADGGGLIINPIAKGSVHTSSIEKNLASDFINTCIQNKIYIEAFSAKDWFIQKGNPSEVISRRSLILQKNPIIVDSLTDEAKKHEIIRLQAIFFTQADKEKLRNLLESYQNRLTSIWTMHPTTIPWDYFLATAPGVSKASAAEAVAKQLGIPLENTLGIGDTLGDWEFMKLCSYAAAMEDGSEELKKLVESKGKEKYFIAPSVNEDGILKVFDYFLNSV